ncbi:hypothetical protein ACHAXN_012208 [Cyclotella atomus]
MVRPDPVQSSVSIKREVAEDTAAAAAAASSSIDEEANEIVREIDVFISPELATKLHLLQFPIQPAASQTKARKPRQPEPIDAKFRPLHRMLELQYSIPQYAKGVPERPLPDTMCLTSRTFTSSHIKPVTHMALAKLSKDGTRLDVVPMQTGILQMRPSFNHLHMHDDDEDDANNKPDDNNAQSSTSSSGRQKSLALQKKQEERSAMQKRNSYAYKRASEESEEWIPLDIHGNTHDGGGGWTAVKKEYMERVKCKNRHKELKLSNGMSSKEGYVRSLNYLDSSTCYSMNQDLSDWKPSSAVNDNEGIDDEIEDLESSAIVGETEKAAAELAAKLVVLLQNGNGATIPYRVIRARLNAEAVSDEVLTMALSSCAVLVRGNFCLKSSLAQFINVGGSGNAKGRTMRELRDLILLLINMHGMVKRERLVRVYGGTGDEPAVVNPETITLLLQTVAQRTNGDNCWTPKVQDDEDFAAKFPEVAAFHGVYWMKKKTKMKRLVEMYESASNDEDMEDI